MPAWMEKIKDRLSAKEDLKSLFIELQPDNRVSTVMVVSYLPTDKDSFQVFMDLTARIATDQKTVPDNLLLHFEGIPAGDIPFTGELPAEDSEKALRFIVSHGGITENNSVPLRKAAYLRACQKELTAENFQALDHSPDYKRFIAYEDAMEKVATGKQARQFYTIVETEQGIRVFNDGLSGTGKFRDYLQSIADNFYSNSLQDVESLNIYRIETVSRRMLELSNGNQTSMPQAAMEILANYKPSVTFDMHPIGENLDRFVTANALELSARNRNIMTLQDIAGRGYAHLPADESFAYKKDFLPVEKGIREITRQKDLRRDYPFQQKTDELQTAARSLAGTLLNRDGIRKDDHRTSPAVGVSKDGQVQTIVKPQDKPESPHNNEKKKIRTKTASPKKSAKPKL